MFRIIVIELQDMGDQLPDAEIERYRQTVDVLDLPKLIDVINAKPRKPRERKAKGAA